MSNERYNPFTEVALGKCGKCHDQLLSVPCPVPFHAPDARRIMCPVCTLRELVELKQRLEITLPKRGL